MMSFYLSGGVEVLGFISPTEPTDEYPVIDPLYGIDGFRNVNTLSDLNLIPNLRRRAGMVVGIGGGTTYYKLNPSPWNGTITDWSLFQIGSGGGTFTGGTVTGNTVFTQGVTATTISATTYQNLPLDVYTTGFTFNPSNYDISVELNDGTTLTQNLGILATDVTITGGTYDPLNGSITFVNNTGGTFTVTGFITGFTDIQVTGYTYQDNTFTISDSSGNTFSTTIDTVTGLTVNGDLTVTGDTIFTQGVTATTFSASTYLGLPLDVYVTGGTYSNGTILFTNNSGSTFDVSGLYTGQTSYVNSLTTGVGLSANTTTGDITIINTDPDQIVTLSGGTGILTGGTYPNFTIENTLPDQTVVLNNGSNISVTGTYPNFTVGVTGLTDNDRYVTGFTYQNNTFTISDNSGSTFSATINTVTGLTVNGILSATTISGGTLYGDGSNLTGLSSGLNVGTTQITNGTDGRILFQSGTTLQQDSNFNYDATLKRLTLRAVGTGVNDIPFVIQNSGGTTNIAQVNGVGSLLFRSNDTFSYAGLVYRSDGTNGWSLTNSHLGYGQGTGLETVGGNNYILSLGTRALSIQRQSTGSFKTYGIWNYGSDSGQRLLIGENVFDPQVTLSGLGNLGIGTYTAGARLDVRAQGLLSTDIVFRVRNSSDTSNIFTVRGDGFVGINTDTPRSNGTYSSVGLAIKNGATEIFSTYNEGGVALGAGATVTNFSGLGNIITGVAIGLNTYSWQNSVSIGPSSTANSTSTISIGQSNTVGGSAGVRLIALGSSIDANTTSGSGSDNIAIGSSLITGRDNNLNIVIGTHLGNRFNFGGSLSVNRNIYIGGYLDQATNSRNNIITLGYGVSSVSKITPSIDNSFQIYFSDNERSFFVNKNSNVVLRSLQTLVAGTNYDTSATNTITISTGTTPSTNIIDSSQIYVTDRGGTAGRASLHVRSEDGTINVLGDRTGINTSTPQARLHVANADTTLTTGLFSGTGQNILTVVGSGNTTSSPIFTVQGSSGELFSVSDSLVGSLFSVNDISGLPILEVFSDNTTLIGSYLAPSLNTTVRVIATTGTTNVYSIPTSAYTGAFFDYTVSDGTNLRAGNIMSIWSGSSVNITETQTTDFGNTSGLTFNMVVSSGNAILRTSGTTGNWTVKTIVRSI
jgi:hypothetical protein